MFWPLTGTKKSGKHPPKSAQNGPPQTLLEQQTPFFVRVARTTLTPQKREKTTKMKDSGGGTSAEAAAHLQCCSDLQRHRQRRCRDDFQDEGFSQPCRPQTWTSNVAL